ncbi:hypothetical protein A3A39_00080 [Candidatus Kaiserbacteria bacterium RIFCSPLOWO2_01_FULL_54_13]|uniref:NADPH-dependent FMN reductase-like domain-containing protein n=1 Tax=Candidatus Kaiserbacteria bacterium RIFCSPLOWO2_01_FULL_54_13 TaxID=1798512 RepID=A0A1F6F4A7_9BACT|nr:MAG: hypothetical protein A3A39_00080 [Candidatus Kaiserbacteria bacterium RIFCSPLOWO2_01_FULL_54_13]
MAEKLRIKVILGSTRPNRFSEYPGRWIFEVLDKREEVEAELLDLRDYPMPFFNEAETPGYKSKPYTHESVANWTAKIAEADAYIVVSPEYSHGYSAVLKNALDYVYQEWNNKPVAFVAYGSVGGSRAVEQLRQVAIELQMVPIRNAVHIQAHWNLLDEKGALKSGSLEPYVRSAEEMLEQLLWWTKTLKRAREEA